MTGQKGLTPPLREKGKRISKGERHPLAMNSRSETRLQEGLLGSKNYFNALEKEEWGSCDNVTNRMFNDSVSVSKAWRRIFIGGGMREDEILRGVCRFENRSGKDRHPHYGGI